MTISKVQGATAASAGANTVTTSFANTPTEGNLLIACVRQAAGTFDTATVSGFTKCIRIDVTSSGEVYIFYKVAGASESKDVVAACTGATTMIQIIFEWSGISSATLDKTASTATTGSAVTSRSSGTTATTTANNELCIAAFGFGSTTSSQSFSNSYTDEYSFDSVILHAASLIQTSAAAQETTESWTTARWACGCIATFKDGTVEISAAGNIASAEALGAPTASLDISPTGISGAEAFGAPSISLEVAGAGGIASVEVLGQPSASVDISPTGISGVEAFGTASISLDVSGSGAIASAEALGEPTTSLDISPTGISGAEAFGAPSISLEVAGAGGIASAEAFGAPVVTEDAGIYNISGAGNISGVEAFGTASISLEVAGAGGIASAEALGQPTVTDYGYVYYISEAGNISGAEAFGAPSISPNVSGAGGIASAEALGEPIVSSPFNLAVVDALVNLASLSDYESKQASISEALIFLATATDSR